MPRWDGFGRSLVFAALAGVGMAAAVALAGPLLGAEAAARLYVVVAAATYAAGLTEDRSRRRAAIAFAAVAGLALALLPIGLRATALGAAAIVAFARSALLQHQRPLRALAIEGLLGALGLAAADTVHSGGLAALCLAVWAYFLVQASYFLFGGRAPRAGAPPRDPFEQARTRLERLLED